MWPFRAQVPVGYGNLKEGRLAFLSFPSDLPCLLTEGDFLAFCLGPLAFTIRVAVSTQILFLPSAGSIDRSGSCPLPQGVGGSSKDAVSVVLVPWPRASPLASSQSPPLTSAVTSRSDRSTRLAQSCAHTGLLPPCCGHRAPSCKGGPGAMGITCW